ncbi:hypothetical protein JCM11641_002885 [Rhodosporidiobolus odoratus]
MHVFVTGPTGFIGSAVLPELLSRGHTVLALARTAVAAQKLQEQQGVEVHRGSLDDLDSLKAGAAKADGVIHLAFKHDFSNFLGSAQLDEQVTTALANSLAGTNKPLVIASATGPLMSDPTRDPSVPATEDHLYPSSLHKAPRIASEQVIRSFASQGVRGSIVRLPPSVHGPGDPQFVPGIISAARRNGVSPYVGEGANIWPGVHVLDAARVFRLALEKGIPGSVFHALGDNDTIAFKDMATIIGEKLSVPVKSISPEDAQAHFGFLAMFAKLHSNISADTTKEVLRWKSEQVTLREDLENGSYFV